MTEREDKEDQVQEREAPAVSVKRLGQAARRFDESLTRGVAAGSAGAFGFFSKRVRHVLHSGYLQNYAFVIFAALIFAAAALVLFLTYGR